MGAIGREWARAAVTPARARETRDGDGDDAVDDDDDDDDDDDSSDDDEDVERYEVHVDRTPTVSWSAVHA